MPKILIPMAVLAIVMVLSASGVAAPNTRVEEPSDEPHFGSGVSGPTTLVRGRTYTFRYTAVADSVQVLRVTLLPLPRGLRFVKQGSTRYVIDAKTRRPTWVLRNLRNPDNIVREFVFRVKVYWTSPLYKNSKPACIRLKQVIARASAQYPKQPTLFVCRRVVRR